MKTFKVLMIVTSHAQLGATGRRTGLWFEELAAPYYVFADAGASVDLASPAGGPPPVDPASVADPTEAVERFRADAEAMRKLEATQRLDAVSETYDAYFVAGGHGVMWDLAGDAATARLLGDAADAGKIVAAVCHGPAALVAARRRDGTPLVAGKRLTAFSNEEERAVKLDREVPFLLEDRLRALGATYEHGALWSPFVVRDGLLVTGQNPKSSVGVAREVLRACDERSAAAPEGHPVTMTLRLTAKDPQTFKEHLLRVIPVTRQARGCRYSHSYQDTSNPAQFLLVQEWDSLADQQRYMSWRTERGDVATLLGLLTSPPVVESFELFDSGATA